MIGLTRAVLGVSASEHRPAGPFMILDLDVEPSLVHIENQDTGLFLAEEADLFNYRLVTVLNVALAPDATAELIESIALKGPTRS